MLPNALERSIIIDLPDLAAGVDIAAEVVFRAPVGGMRVFAVRVIFRTATVGVDGANSLQIDLNGPDGEIATTGALVANQAANAVLSPAVANPRADAGEDLTIDITQGATADIGRAQIQVDYRPLVT